MAFAFATAIVRNLHHMVVLAREARTVYFRRLKALRAMILRYYS
jgi:hypothetical protein